MKILTIETTIKLTKGINRVSVKGDLKIKNPVRGFIISKNNIPKIARMIKMARKILRILEGSLDESSIRYLTFSWDFKSDLKLILEINSWRVPMGHANPQKILPTIRDVANNRLKTIITGSRELIKPLPLRMKRICWIGITA